MARYFLIAIATVDPTKKPFGENQTFHKLLDRDLASTQLGFKCEIAVCLEGVEEQLAVGALDQDVHAAAADPLFGRGEVGALIAAQHHAVGTGILG